MAPPITCSCGDCYKCHRREYMREWYRRNREHVLDRIREARQRNGETIRERDRKRGYRPRDPQKVAARKAVRVLPKQPCEVCGVFPADAHHDDYSKPLDVRWLCRKHHGEVHRRDWAEAA